MNIPVMVWVITAAVGVAAYVVSELAGFIPFVKQYAFALRILGVVVTLVGVFMLGGAGVTAVWKEQVAEMEAKVAKSEAQSKDANVKLSAAIKAKKQATHSIQVVIKERIVHDAAKMDAKCVVDPSAIQDLNDAATNKGAK